MVLLGVGIEREVIAALDTGKGTVGVVHVFPLSCGLGQRQSSAGRLPGAI
jgi:hypothetical protein